MKTETRKLVNYFELSEAWQKEARSNCDDYEEQTYIEPLPHQCPEKHTLYDLSEAMRTSKGSEYHAVIGISNNSALGLVFINDMEEVKITYL